MDVILFCPKGNKACEYVKRGKLYRCHWYQNIVGVDPQTGERFDRFDCAVCWSNIIKIEQTQINRGQAAATESLRNHVVEGQNELIQIALQEQEQKRKKQIE